MLRVVVVLMGVALSLWTGIDGHTVHRSYACPSRSWCIPEENCKARHITYMYNSTTDEYVCGQTSNTAGFVCCSDKTGLSEDFIPTNMNWYFHRKNSQVDRLAMKVVPWPGYHGREAKVTHEEAPCTSTVCPSDSVCLPAVACPMDSITYANGAFSTGKYSCGQTCATLGWLCCSVHTVRNALEMSPFHRYETHYINHNDMISMEINEELKRFHRGLETAVIALRKTFLGPAEGNEDLDEEGEDAKLLSGSNSIRKRRDVSSGTEHHSTTEGNFTLIMVTQASTFMGQAVNNETEVSGRTADGASPRYYSGDEASTPQSCGVPLASSAYTYDLDKNGAASTKEGQYPWHVAILTKNLEYLCAGVVVADKYVVTVAHCVDQYLVQDLRVRVGDYDLSADSETYKSYDVLVVQMAFHPNYTRNVLKDDVVVLEIQHPVLSLPNVGRVCLPGETSATDRQECFVSAWGSVSPARGEASRYTHYEPVLRHSQYVIIGRDRCRDQFRNTGTLGAFFKLLPGVLCCKGFYKDNTCHGDGGSGLVCRTNTGELILEGLVSWSAGCDKGLPTAFVDITYYLGFILRVIKGIYSSQSYKLQTHLQGAAFVQGSGQSFTHHQSSSSRDSAFEQSASGGSAFHQQQSSNTGSAFHQQQSSNTGSAFHQQQSSNTGSAFHQQQSSNTGSANTGSAFHHHQQSTNTGSAFHYHQQSTNTGSAFHHHQQSTNTGSAFHHHQQSSQGSSLHQSSQGSSLHQSSQGSSLHQSSQGSALHQSSSQGSTLKASSHASKSSQTSAATSSGATLHSSKHRQPVTGAGHNVDPLLTGIQHPPKADHSSKPLTRPSTHGSKRPLKDVQYDEKKGHYKRGEYREQTKDRYRYDEKHAYRHGYDREDLYQDGSYFDKDRYYKDGHYDDGYYYDGDEYHKDGYHGYYKDGHYYGDEYYKGHHGDYKDGHYYDGYYKDGYYDDGDDGYYKEGNYYDDGYYEDGSHGYYKDGYYYDGDGYYKDIHYYDGDDGYYKGHYYDDDGYYEDGRHGYYKDGHYYDGDGYYKDGHYYDGDDGYYKGHYYEDGYYEDGRHGYYKDGHYYDGDGYYEEGHYYDGYYKDGYHGDYKDGHYDGDRYYKDGHYYDGKHYYKGHYYGDKEYYKDGHHGDYKDSYYSYGGDGYYKAGHYYDGDDGYYKDGHHRYYKDGHYYDGDDGYYKDGHYYDGDDGYYKDGHYYDGDDGYYKGGHHGYYKDGHHYDGDDGYYEDGHYDQKENYYKDRNYYDGDRYYRDGHYEDGPYYDKDYKNGHYDGYGDDHYYDGHAYKKDYDHFDDDRYSDDDYYNGDIYKDHYYDEDDAHYKGGPNYKGIYKGRDHYRDGWDSDDYDNGPYDHHQFEGYYDDDDHHYYYDASRDDDHYKDGHYSDEDWDYKHPSHEKSYVQQHRHHASYTKHAHHSYINYASGHDARSHENDGEELGEAGDVDADDGEEVVVEVEAEAPVQGIVQYLKTHSTKKGT